MREVDIVDSVIYVDGMMLATRITECHRKLAKYIESDGFHPILLELLAEVNEELTDIGVNALKEYPTAVFVQKLIHLE